MDGSNTIKVVTFTQALTGQPVALLAHQVYAVTYMPTMKATVVVAVGGASIPVNETVEEVKAAVVAALNTNEGVQADGT